MKEWDTGRETEKRLIEKYTHTKYSKYTEGDYIPLGREIEAAKEIMDIAYKLSRHGFLADHVNVVDTIVDILKAWANGEKCYVGSLE